MPEYLFGNFDLDPAGYRLGRDGEIVSVEPLVLELIVYLVVHRNRVVGREELFENVWEGRVVSDGTLAKAIHGARATLGENPDGEGWIRTVRGRGYRFVGAVEERTVDEEPPTAAEASESSRGESTRPLRRFALPLIAAISLGAALVLWWATKGATPPPSSGPLAVLPLINATGDENLDWLQLGLMDELASSLSDDHGLNVVPTEEVLEAFRAAGLTLGSRPEDSQLSLLRQALGAARLLDAVVRRETGLFRLEATIHREDLASASRVASGSDLRSIAAHVTERLSGDLGTSDDLPLHPVSDDPSVREAYARGVHELLAENSAGARPYFEAVLDREPGLPEARYRLALALGELGEWEESERIVRGLLGETSPTESTDLTARAHRQLGRLLHQQGDAPGALEAFGTALAHARAVGDRRAEIDLLARMGSTTIDLADWEAARERYDLALSLTRELGYEAGRAQIEFGLGVLAGRRGRLAEADEHFTAELELRQRLGHRRAEARTLHNLAANAQNRGRWSRSEELHRQALALRRELGDRPGVASSLVNLAVTNTWRGDLDAAEHDAAEARTIFEELGNPRGAAMADYVQAYVALGGQDWEEAVRRTREALATWKELGAARREPLALATLAEIADEAGRVDEAEKLASEAHRLAEELEDRNLTAYTLRVRGRAARLAEKPGDAERLLREALAIAGEVGNEGIEGSILEDLAGLLLDLGRADDAAPLVSTLEKRFPESGPVALLGARLALARDDGPAALEAAERARDRSLDLWNAEDQLVLDRSRRAVAADG